jgi:hypothetical protein
VSSIPHSDGQSPTLADQHHKALAPRQPLTENAPRPFGVS